MPVHNIKRCCWCLSLFVSEKLLLAQRRAKSVNSFFSRIAQFVAAKQLLKSTYNLIIAFFFFKLDFDKLGSICVTLLNSCNISWYLMAEKVRVWADTQLILGGLLHQQGELPHEVTAELVLLRRSRHHGQPHRLGHAGHGVEVTDGHPGDEGGRDKRERVWEEQMKEGWKREKTERTDMLLSLRVNKRALSSQSFAVWAEASGDPWLCVLFVQQTYTSHNPVSRHVQCVCVYIHLYGRVCPLRRNGLSMERGACWWACLGWGPSFDTRAEGESLQHRECGESGTFEKKLKCGRHLLEYAD